MSSTQKLMLTKQSLGKNLKAMGKKAAYFITSDDDFIAANRAREIFEELSKDALDEMSKEVIDGASQKVEDAARACAQTLHPAAIWRRKVRMAAQRKFFWRRKNPKKRGSRNYPRKARRIFKKTVARKCGCSYKRLPRR